MSHLPLRVTLLFCVLLLFPFLVIGNPALYIYKEIERGALEGVEWSPLFCRSGLEVSIGFPLDLYGCTEEPFYVHVDIKNARDIGSSLLPYNLYWEAHQGDFFHVRHKNDPTIKAKYIGPQATHIFPIKEEEINDYLIHLQPKIHIEGKKYEYPSSYSFEIDVARSYEYPVSGLYMLTPDAPLYFYDFEKKELVLHRLWGTTRHIKANYAEECVNSRITVNEISKDGKIKFNLCSDENQVKFQSIFLKVKTLASYLLQYIDDAEKNSISENQNLLLDCFGASATSVDSYSHLRSVFEKIRDFLPSVIECDSFFEGILSDTREDVLPPEEREKFLFHYYMELEEREKADEDEDEEEEEEEEPVYEIIDDHSNVKDLRHKCAKGVTSWLIPRDLSSTINVCPVLFTLDEDVASLYLMDSILRFEKVADAIDYLFGDDSAHSLAQKYDTEVSFKNVGNYILFARKATNKNEALVNADV